MKILIAEDEPAISGILEANLQHAGFKTRVAENGLDAISLFRADPPDVVLLDVMLPKKNGYEVCRKLRESDDVPIIMISARNSESDRLKGFEIGADDYVCKPFSPREVIARINSIIRRSAKEPVYQSDAYKDTIVTVPEFTVCQSSLTAMFMGKSLSLTLSEFNLLVTFVSRPNRVFERTHLLDILAQHGSHCTDRAVDCHIKNLRQKLRQIRPNKTIIQTIYGVGYKFSYPIV